MYGNLLLPVKTVVGVRRSPATTFRRLKLSTSQSLLRIALHSQLNINSIRCVSSSDKSESVNRWRLVRRTEHKMCNVKEDWSWELNSDTVPKTPPIPKPKRQAVCEVITKTIKQEAVNMTWTFVIGTCLQIAIDQIGNRYKGIVMVSMLLSVVKQRKWPEYSPPAEISAAKLFQGLQTVYAEQFMRFPDDAFSAVVGSAQRTDQTPQFSEQGSLACAISGLWGFVSTSFMKLGFSPKDPGGEVWKLESDDGVLKNWSLKRHSNQRSGPSYGEEWHCQTDSGLPPPIPAKPKPSETLTDVLKKSVKEETVKMAWTFILGLTVQIAFDQVTTKYQGVAAVATLVTLIKHKKLPKKDTE